MRFPSLCSAFKKRKPRSPTWILKSGAAGARGAFGELCAGHFASGGVWIPPQKLLKQLTQRPSPPRGCLSDRGRWSEGYAWAFFVCGGPRKGEAGASAATLLRGLCQLPSLFAVPKLQALSSWEPGHRGREAGWESSVWSFRNSPVMLQDLTGAPGAAVRPAEASLSLCRRLSLHCGSLLLTCSGGPGQAAAVLGSAPSVGSRGCRSSFLWLGEEKACYPGFARRGRSISCLNLSVWLPYVLPPFQQLKH